MVRVSCVRKLARELAAAAVELRAQCGDVDAQTQVYSLLMRQWNAGTTNSAQLSSLMLDSVVELAQSDTAEQVREYYENQGRNAAVYFYEEFLRAFDGDYSGKRGVRYSPPEVVSYMVRGAADILEKKLNTSIDGTLLLDPCCGIGTFPHFIETRTEFRPQMVGLELNPATCILARCLLKHCHVLQADSLEEVDLPIDGRPLIVIGNPPYSGHSANSGSVAGLLTDYHKGLNERNPKWLQDDYVKFIRMAQHRVELAGRGIVAFITNHSFMFNPTFRAMRESLMGSFDEIYVLDLHGNAKKLEKSSGEPDENVFPIQMGVAISFMVKWPDRAECRVYHAELRGKSETKLKALAGMTFEETPWNTASTAAPHFSFTVRDADLQSEFYGFSCVKDIFGVSSVGFVTSRDSFAVDTDMKALLGRISALRDGTVSDEVLRTEMGAGDLDIQRAREELRADKDWREKVVEVLYRPFDKRWAYYSRAVMERPRLPFMENMVKDNLAIAVGRAGHATGSEVWDVVFCTDCPADLNLFRRGGALLLPRWVYRDEERQSNMEADTDHYKLFSYIYALLHSTIYRKRYADLLSLDFPRIPVPHDKALLSRLSELGTELIEIHLMRRQIDTGNLGAVMTVGGYCIPQKFLDDRRGRELDQCEQARIDQISAAVSATLSVQQRIDEVIFYSPPWD